MASPSEITSRVHAYLSQLGLDHEGVGENLWLIHDAASGLPHLVVLVQESVLVMRARIMDVPEHDRERFFEDLLRFNLLMVHGAYAIDGESVIWVDTLEFETMEIEEFEASLKAVADSVAHHSGRLARYAEGKSNGSI